MSKGSQAISSFQVVHFSPGRLRVRMVAVSTDPAFASQLETMLSSIDGIHRASTRPLTGSLLVEYDPSALDIDSLLALGRLLRLIPDDAPSGLEPPAADPLDASASQVGQAIGAVIEHSGRLVSQVLHPSVAMPAIALSQMAQEFGIISPAAAAAWIITSILIQPTQPRVARR